MPHPVGRVMGMTYVMITYEGDILSAPNVGEWVLPLYVFIHSLQRFLTEELNKHDITKITALRWHRNPVFPRSTNLESKLVDFFAFINF